MVAWKIGPTFAAECVAAGVQLNGWSWSITTGEIAFDAGVSEAMVDSVNAVYAAHDPALQTDPPTLPYPPGGGPPVPPPPPVQTRWQVDQQTILERLDQAHKFDAFIDAVNDGTLLARELWHARYRVWNDDPLVIGLLQKAGADPAIILARP